MRSRPHSRVGTLATGSHKSCAKSVGSLKSDIRPARGESSVRPRRRWRSWRLRRMPTRRRGGHLRNYIYIYIYIYTPPTTNERSQSNGWARLVSKSLSSRATRYIRCRPSPSPTVNVYNTPACQGRARLNGSSRRPAPTHTRTHTYAHPHTRAQARARDRAHGHAHAPARERERGRAPVRESGAD